MMDPLGYERFKLFHSKIEESPAPDHLGGNCWLWTGSIDRNGYGRFYCPGFPSFNGSRNAGCVYAHRWAAVFWFGAMALRRLTYDHLCLRKRCVNPRHSARITHSENVARGNVTRHLDGGYNDCIL